MEMTRLRRMAAVRDNGEVSLTGRERCEQFQYDLQYFFGIQGKRDAGERLAYKQKYVMSAAFALLFITVVVGIGAYSCRPEAVVAKRTQTNSIYIPSAPMTQREAPLPVGGSNASAAPMIASSAGAAVPAKRNVRSDNSGASGILAGTNNIVSSSIAGKEKMKGKTFRIPDSSGFAAPLNDQIVVFDKPTDGSDRDTELEQAVLTEDEAERFMPGIKNQLQHLSTVSPSSQTPFNVE